jgi:hypothetical protein
MKIIMARNITRQDVRSNPDKIYLFGDNLIGKGYGGQAAEMRGEPNAIGIPTKKAPSMAEFAFFNNKDYDVAIQAIDNAFAKIPEDKDIVIPTAGLGGGRAQLSYRAPRIWKYLQNKLLELVRNKEIEL